MKGLKSSFGVCNAAERMGRALVTDAITTPVVNTSMYFFKKSADLIDWKVFFFHPPICKKNSSES